MARPLLGPEEAAAVARVLALGLGDAGAGSRAAFEREFAAFVGAPHACAVSSGTAALHLALLAVGVRRGRRGGHGQPLVHRHGEQRAPLRARRRCSSTSSRRTFNIDPARVEAAIGPRTRAILCVHQLGMPCDLDGARGDRARGAACALVEDAACAVGSEIAVDGALGADRAAARRRRLLQLSSAQAHHHRRRRHGDDARRRRSTRACAPGARTARATASTASTTA